jgi:hypothetical protein
MEKKSKEWTIMFFSAITETYMDMKLEGMELESGWY